MGLAAKKEHEVPRWKVEIASMVAEGKRFPEGTAQKRIQEFAKERGLNWKTVSTTYYNFKSKIPTAVLDILTDPKKADSIEQPEGVEIADPVVEPEPQQEEQQEQIEDSTAEPDDQPEQDEPKAEAVTAEPETVGPAKEPEVKPEPPKSENKPRPGSNPWNDVYPTGSTIEVKVESVIDRAGIVVRPVGDQYGLEGWIHIGEITNKFVSDVNKFFRVGDVIRAKVIGFENVRQQLRLSTRDMPLKEHGVKDPAAGYKAYSGVQKREGVRVEEQNQRLEALKLELAAKQQEEHDKMGTLAQGTIEEEKQQTALSVVMQDEMKEVSGFLKSVIGWDASDAAIEAFRKLITEHGLFKTSLALGRVADGFSPDLGLILAEQVKTKLGGRPLSN